MVLTTAPLAAGVWGVSAFVGTTLGPVCAGTALFLLGHIADSDGGGGEQPGAGVSEYRYSLYGYLGVEGLGAVWNVLACVVVSRVKGVN